jgi:hypothetical protein
MVLNQLKRSSSSSFAKKNNDKDPMAASRIKKIEELISKIDAILKK